MTTNSDGYEYPLGSKPTEAERKLMEAAAKIVEGSAKNYLLIYETRNGPVLFYPSDVEAALDLLPRATVILTEKRRQEDK
jgi:hypothetical protein